MARKSRDYKAEYAARKRRATRAGYKSIREYSTARRRLKLPPRTSPIPKRIALKIEPEVVDNTHDSFLSRLRRESRRWSDAHSLRHTSRYNRGMSDDEVIAYHATYVDRVEGSRKAYNREKRKRLHKWLVPRFMTQAEWESAYPL